MTAMLSDYGDDFFDALNMALSSSEQSTESLREIVQHEIGRPVLKSQVMRELELTKEDGFVGSRIEWIRPGGCNERPVYLWRWLPLREEVMQ